MRAQVGGRSRSDTYPSYFCPPFAWCATLNEAEFVPLLAAGAAGTVGGIRGRWCQAP